jgi:hypothetical protein
MAFSFFDVPSLRMSYLPDGSLQTAFFFDGVTFSLDLSIGSQFRLRQTQTGGKNEQTL